MDTVPSNNGLKLTAPCVHAYSVARGQKACPLGPQLKPNVRHSKLIGGTKLAVPTCFISYSWDSEDHKDWVRRLAKRLQENGVKVALDQWDIHPGRDLPEYMETSIRESEFVLLVCTPQFAEKANLGKGGVGYEKSIVTGEIFFRSHAPKKFVPILRIGDQLRSLPSYLKSRVFIDFRDAVLFEERLVELLRHIYNSPTYSPPPIGARPSFSNTRELASTSEKDKREKGQGKGLYCSRCGATTGKASKCPGWTAHNFVESTGRLYCSRCGAVVGIASQCPGWTAHNFVGTEGPVHCARCGAVPGEASKCPGWTAHNFVKVTGPVYCSRCGALPGEVSNCPGWTGHNFVPR